MQDMTRDFEVKLFDFEKIKLTAYGNNPNDYKHHVIYVHGFKGFKDWGFIPYLGEYLASNGIYFFAFNFSHNGIGEIPTEITEIDKFAKNTFSREIFELNTVMDAYAEGFFGNNRKAILTLLGHSRGGAIAALCAKHSSVEKLALWSAIAKLDRYTERQKQVWRKDGFVEIINTRTNQIMRLNTTLLDDIENNKNTSLSLQSALKELKKPLLIAHGTNDLTVPISEGELLYSWSNQDYSNLIKIENAGHTFDASHPFTESNAKLDKLIDETVRFITQK